jgi:hypothetical protein
MRIIVLLFVGTLGVGSRQSFASFWSGPSLSFLSALAISPHTIDIKALYLGRQPSGAWMLALCFDIPFGSVRLHPDSCLPFSAHKPWFRPRVLSITISFVWAHMPIHSFSCSQSVFHLDYTAVVPAAEASIVEGNCFSVVYNALLGPRWPWGCGVILQAHLHGP